MELLYGIRIHLLDKQHMDHMNKVRSPDKETHFTYIKMKKFLHIHLARQEHLSYKKNAIIPYKKWKEG